jgi:hypothetical protein
MSKPEQKVDHIMEDKKRQDKTIFETRKKVRDELEKRTKGISGGMAELIADMMPEILLGDAIEYYGSAWAAERREIADTQNEDLLIELANKTSPYLNAITKAGELSVKYIEEMTESSQGGQAGPEVLLKMRDSLSGKAKYLAEALTKQGNEKLMAAMEWSLGLMTDTQLNRQKAFEGLSEIFSKSYIQDCTKSGPEKAQLQTPVGWVLVSFMSTENRKSFTEFIIKKHSLSPEEIKAFFNAGAWSGAIPPNEIPAKVKFTEPEDQKMRIAYAVQNDFLKKGRDLIRRSYGAENDAGRMLNLKNMLLVFAMAASGVSVGGTIIANMFTQGTIKDPAKVLALLSKKSVLVGAGVGTAAYMLLNPKPGRFEPKESRETKKQRETAENLYMVVNTNRGWNEFLTANKYKGAEIMFEFANYVRRKDNLDDSMITLEEFVYWLDKKAKGKENPEKYKFYLSRIRKSDDEIYEIGGFRTNDDDLKRLVHAVDFWKMGGTQAQERYLSAIKFAQLT